MGGVRGRRWLRKGGDWWACLTLLGWVDEWVGDRGTWVGDRGSWVGNVFAWEFREVWWELGEVASVLEVGCELWEVV